MTERQHFVAIVALTSTMMLLGIWLDIAGLAGVFGVLCGGAMVHLDQAT